jgi:hypothetical protein
LYLLVERLEARGWRLEVRGSGSKQAGGRLPARSFRPEAAGLLAAKRRHIIRSSG